LIPLGFNSYETAWSEEAAVEAARRRRPDLVLVGDRIEQGSRIRAARRIALAHDVPVLLTRSGARFPVDLGHGVVADGPFALADLAHVITRARVPACWSAFSPTGDAIGRMDAPHGCAPDSAGPLAARHGCWSDRPCRAATEPSTHA
jgi:hypothetical protein